MKSRYIMMAALLWSSLVLAGNNNQNNSSHVNKSKNVAVSQSNAKAAINTHNVNSHNNTNTATGGTANAEGGDATAGAVAAGGAGGNSNSNANSSNGGQTVVDNAKDIPVMTAYSASLTSGIDTCLGSGSAGVQTMIVGVTGGKTYVDHHCEMIKDVQLLKEMNLDQAACFRARSGEEGKSIDAAMTAAGVDCNNYHPKMVAAPTPVATVKDEVLTPVDPPVTHEELKQVEDRIVKKVVAK